MFLYFKWNIIHIQDYLYSFLKKIADNLTHIYRKLSQNQYLQNSNYGGKRCKNIDPISTFTK